MLPVADLVDTDGAEVVERVAHLLALTVDVPLDDLADRSPRDAHEGGDSGLVGPLGVVGDVALHWTGEATRGLGPRDRLDDHATLLAADTTDPIAKQGLDAAEVEVTPGSDSRIVDVSTLLAAATAAGNLPVRRDVGDECFLVELDGDDASSVEGEEGSEYTSGTHAGWAAFGWCRNPKGTPSPAAHFFTPPNLLPRSALDSCAWPGPDSRPLNRQESHYFFRRTTTIVAGRGLVELPSRRPRDGVVVVDEGGSHTEHRFTPWSSSWPSWCGSWAPRTRAPPSDVRVDRWRQRSPSCF